MAKAICHTMTNESGFKVETSSMGASLRRLIFPNGRDVLLGFETEEEYETDRHHFGGTMGRCTNRVAHGQYMWDGRMVRLTRNRDGNMLHGGNIGFDVREFTVIEASAGRVVYELHSPDREEGFPGNLTLRVTYELREEALNIYYEAECDQDTLVNLTNHAYFNLTGDATVKDHVLTVQADFYTPMTGDGIPTGEITRLSRKAGRIEDWWDTFDVKYLDHNFIKQQVGSGRAAILEAPGFPWALEIYTTYPAFQVFTSCNTDGVRGKADYVYNAAVCVEPQYTPDAINQSGHEKPVLLAGKKYEHSISYHWRKL